MNARPYMNGSSRRTGLIAAVVVLAVLLAMAFTWDPHDLGDGLMLGRNAVVNVWDGAASADQQNDFLFGAPTSATTAAHR